LIKNIVIIPALLLALCLAAPAAAQSGAGTISGQVVNSTPGGGSVAGLEVTLVTYINGEPKDDTDTALTDASGNFTFAGLNTGQEYNYAAAVSYQDVTYASFLSSGDLPAFPEGETSRSITIAVYETTRDDSSVRLMLAHMVLFAENQTLLASEYYLFVNNGDRTFIGKEGDPGVLHFSLPPGAAGLQVGFGPGQAQVVSAADGFWDTRPMSPGGSEVGYTYEMGLKSGKLDLSRPIDYPTAQFDVLVPQGSLDVSGARLVAGEPVTVSGMVLSDYVADNLTAGESLTMTISRPSRGGLSGLWWALIGAAVVIVGFGLFYLFRRMKKPKAPSTKSGSIQRQQRLLAELAALDDRFDAGEIDENVYRKQRDEKKAELARLMRSQRGTTEK
jgi:uncharacterized membrane protein